MKKTVEFEVVRVHRTQEESELKKAFNKFKEVCSIGEKIIHEDNRDVPEGISEITVELTKDIKKRTREITDLIRTNLRL